MLSECYYTTGNQSEAIQQANRADSLQSHYAQEQMNIRRKMISESLQNELLSTRLKSQKMEAEQARLIQYILTGIIILLMAILTGGYLWWRNHRRRLRQLFDLLISHHAAWLLIHDPLPLISRPQIKLPDHSTLNRQTGMNFSRWLAEYRVHHLLSLVALRPDSDITALASESGFTSRTSFFRQFRQVTGLTPNQYRNVRKETGK